MKLSKLRCCHIDEATKERCPNIPVVVIRDLGMDTYENDTHACPRHIEDLMPDRYEVRSILSVVSPEDIDFQSISPQTIFGYGQPCSPTSFIDIVFDGPPAHESGRFIEVEDESGKSISVGEWIRRDPVKGADSKPITFWALRIPWHDDGGLRLALKDIAEGKSKVPDEILLAGKPALHEFMWNFSQQRAREAINSNALRRGVGEGEVLEALKQCDVVMESAVLHGINRILPPAYKDSWCHAHVNARNVIAKAESPPPSPAGGGDAENFLATAATNEPFQTPHGLRKIPFSLRPRIAQLMEEYATHKYPPAGAGAAMELVREIAGYRYEDYGHIHWAKKAVEWVKAARLVAAAEGEGDNSFSTKGRE